MKVYLSPSDQWSNIVADGEHSEAYHCTKIAKSAKKYFEKYGYTVYVGNNAQEGSYVKRVEESNRLNADIHICIHTNAGGGQGTLVMTYPTTVNNKYVTSIYKSIADLTPTNDKGIQARTDLFEITETNAICIYIEIDFHDSITIENWIDHNIDIIGKTIADGIAKVDGKQFNQTVLYRVQVGAYKNKNNAEKMAKKLKDLGFDTYIVKG